MRYVYVDESEFSEPDKRAGIGILISDVPIEPSIIDNAITALKNDPDISDPKTQKQDTRTIERRYFHACDDSKNAHSHLTTQINLNVNAEFSSDFQKSSSEGIEDLLRRAFVNTAIKALQTREPVEFLIENRSDFSVSLFEELITGLKEHLLHTAYNQPSFPAFYPKHSIRLVDKKCPGTQITDFLLWATNRKVNGDGTWLSRIEKRCRFGFSFENESKSWGGNSININNGTCHIHVNYDLSDMPTNPDELITKKLLAEFLIYASNLCCHYANIRDPNLNHLGEEISYIAKNIINPQVPLVEEIARGFLKIFDTAGIISDNASGDEKRKLLLARKYLGLVLRKDLVHGIMTLSYLRQARMSLIKNQPDLFII